MARNFAKALIQKLRSSGTDGKQLASISWEARLKAAEKRGKFTPRDVGAAASNTSCALGEAVAMKTAMPFWDARSEFGNVNSSMVKDPQVYGGWKDADMGFYSAVQTGDLKNARRLYNLINETVASIELEPKIPVLV